MSLKISACLAAMLVACPLASQTASAEDWDENVNNTKDEETIAESSNNKDVSFPRTSGAQETYDNIFVGHTSPNGTSSGSTWQSGTQVKLVSDSNSGIIGSGVTVSGEVIGGIANWTRKEFSIKYWCHDYEHHGAGCPGHYYDYSYTTYFGDSNVKEIQVLSNSVTLQRGSNVQTAIGGSGYASEEGTISGNSVTVDEGAAVKTIYGGSGGNDGFLITERITLCGNTTECEQMINGRLESNIYPSTFSVSKNTVTATGTQFDSAYGGYCVAKKASAKNNTVEVKNGTSSEAGSSGELIGGYAGGNYYKDDNDGSVEALENAVIVTKSTVNTVYGGKAVERYGSTATAKDNKVTLSDSEVQGTLYAGYAGMYDDSTHSVTSTASDNKLYLYGGSYSGDIYGGYAMVAQGTAEASGNLVALGQGVAGDKPILNNSTIYGGYASAADEAGTTSGNTLRFSNVTGMKAVNIKSFQTLSYEYTAMKADDVILELTGTDSDQETSIANANVNVSVASLYGADGQSEFKTGDKVVLLKNANGLVMDGIQTQESITATTGISLSYVVEVQTSEDGKELILTRTGTKPVDTDDDGKTDGDENVLPGTKAIAEGAASGLALASESSNAAIEFLRDFSLTAGSITPFMHVQASSMRHETGSSINLSTVSFLAGLGTGFDTGAGHLSAGAFFEYGKGSYTTNNSFSNYSDVDGDGNAWYMGAGILAKMEFVETGPGHFYLEGSAHMGTVHNEYDSNDLRDASGNVAKFDMDSPYYSLHGGIGYVWDITDEHELDVYGKYIWTRVQGTDDTLTTRDKFEYDDMDSNRVRFGVRYTYKGSERFSPYVGAAFEHEFSGTCESTAYGHPVASPSFEGSSGMGELGLMMKPTEDLPLSINLGVQGYVGQKQGISGNFTLKYEF